MINSNRRVERLQIMNKAYPDYWDEMISHRARIKGRGRKRKWNYVCGFEWRMFRTWKHNRLNQWKF